MRRGFAAILVLGIIAAVLVLAGAFYLKRHSGVATTMIESQKPSPASQYSPVDQNQTSATDLDKLITFEIPKGWKKQIQSNDSQKYKYVEITSPDYKQTRTESWPGLIITIYKENGSHRQPNPQPYDQRFKEINDEIHNPNPGSATIQNLEKTSVSGYKTLSYYYNFEGYFHYYEIWNGDDVWLIQLGSSSPTIENNYKKEINQILSTFKFTN